MISTAIVIILATPTAYALSRFQPRGKQIRKPHSIWYTPTTGIWQTVWLEPVPNIAIFIVA